MPIYSYKGYDLKSGAARKGRIEAESPKAARQKLKAKDQIIVSEVKEEANLNTAKKTRRVFGDKVSLSDVSIMTRQFATLQSAHVPLDECLKALTQQVDDPILRNTLSAVKDKVSEGISLADSISGFPGVFNRLYVNMVRAGESSGKLDLVLERLADFLDSQEQIKGKVMSAVLYPLIMIAASTLIVAMLFTLVVPKLTKVFSSLRVTLPWYTKLTLGISSFIQNYWYVILAVGVLGVFMFRRWVSSTEGRAKWDGMVLKAPVFGGIIMRVMISRFTKTLSTLLSSGVPIITALEITRNVITNVVIAKVVDESKIAVQEGQSLGRTIEKSGQFPALVTQMIMTGERTGQLEEMLNHVAVAYDAEVERKIEGMISLIEPALIIVMGSTVALVVFALMVPMMSVMNQLRG